MPERPEVSTAVEELYEAMEPAYTTGDESRDWTTLNLCAAIVEGNVAFIHELVTEEEAPGWQILLDPDRCPAKALPYLAQFVGARLRPDMDEEQRRSAIKEPEGFGRGTPAAIVATARRRLTGTKFVSLVERYTGLAYRMKIATLESETPDPELTKAEIIAEQKPIGIRLFFNDSPDWTWEEVALENETWQDVIDEYETWADLLLHEP